MAHDYAFTFSFTTFYSDGKRRPAVTFRKRMLRGSGSQAARLDAAVFQHRGQLLRAGCTAPPVGPSPESGAHNFPTLATRGIQGKMGRFLFNHSLFLGCVFNCWTCVYPLPSLCSTLIDPVSCGMQFVSTWRRLDLLQPQFKPIKLAVC